ncbi:MAG TPA: carboxypeptidase regulatory-like domain-containing protein [Bryobacteraceae bacterium]|nr:carboxypeptidase regulatory-like domain-containing protein [Bryobacteraceae bacterium]
MNTWKVLGIGALSLILLAPFGAFAQSDVAAISGFVRDSSSAVVPGVKVVIKNEAVEFERTATTNNEGYYVVSALPPGFYTVKVEHPGFQTFEVLHKKLDPSIPVSVDVVLTVGLASQAIDVVAQTTAVQSESATLGLLVEHATVELSELNGRNPIFLAGLMPGVIGGTLATNSFSYSTGSFNINGSRNENNIIYFDGAVGIRTRANSSRSIGAADLDATEEVQVLTSNYSAEYGRQSGGEIRVVTKSGTNVFHGAAYEYFRNPILEADTWSRNQTGYTVPSPFHYNQFGFYLSGPVYIPRIFNTKKNRIFFTWGEEFVRQLTDSLNLAVVPTALMRQGNFSELLAPNNIFYNKAEILKDGNGNPYPGNIIPAANLSPNGMAIINAIPQPTPGFLNSSNQNWYYDYPSVYTHQNKHSPGFDWNINEKMQLRFRGQLFVNNNIGISSTYANTIQNNPNKRASLNYVYTISPSWVNEALLAGSADHVTTGLWVGPEGPYARSAYGFNYPYLFPNGKDIPDKIPSTTWPNSPFLALNGSPYPSHSAGPIEQFSDNVTHIWRQHTLKFGYYFEESGENDDDQIVIGSTPGGTNNQAGQFSFSDSTPGGTGLAFANAAIGKFATYAEVGPRSFTPYRNHDNEIWGQDSWKVTARLRLDIGLRWSATSPYSSLWGNIAYFDPSVYNPANAVTINPATGNLSGSPTLPQIYNGMVIPGTGWPKAAGNRPAAEVAGIYNFLFNGKSNTYTNPHYRDFSPRFGIAYALNSKSVFRGGFGRFYDHTGVSDGLFPGGNSPIQQQASVANGNVDNPGGTTATLFPLYILSYQKYNPAPNSLQWNATFQREIGFGTMVSVGYVGRKGVNLPYEQNINQLPIGTCPQGVCPGGVSPNSLVPFKGYSTILQNANLGTSMYHSAQFQATRRFSKGLSFTLAYTYGKSLDNGTSYQTFQPNAYDNSFMWGPSTFDRRHVWQATSVYALPFFKQGNKFLASTVGGWTLSGVFVYQSGTPFAIGTTTDYAGVNSTGVTQYWVQNAPIQITDQYSQGSNASTDSNYYFQPKTASGGPVWSPPANGTFNTQLVRDAYYGPGSWNFNSAIFKDFVIRDRVRFQLRWEQYDVLNHPNWNGPNTSPTSSAFGKITGKSGNRDMQIAGRFSF